MVRSCKRGAMGVQFLKGGRKITVNYIMAILRTGIATRPSAMRESKKRGAPLGNVRQKFGFGVTEAATLSPKPCRNHVEKHSYPPSKYESFRV